MANTRRFLSGILIAGLALLVGLAPALAANLYITEYATGLSPAGSSQAPIPPTPAITTQVVAVGGGSLSSAAFNAKTHAVGLTCDTGCSILFGSTPTATTSTTLLQQGVTSYFGVAPGQKVAVIANTAGSTPGSSGTVTADQGNAGTNAQAWWTRIGDATNGPAAVKAASTAPVATDQALVVALSPNGLNPNGQASAANSAPTVGATGTIAGGATGTAGTAASNVVTIQGIASMTPVTTLSTGQTATGTASASFTSGTTAYATLDVVGGALTFTALCPANANFMVTGAQLEVDSGTLISGQTSYILYLYNVTPPSAIADSSVFDLPSGDRASYLGGGAPLTVPALIDLGSTLYNEGNSLNKQIACSSTGNIFAYLVTVGAYTPTAQVYKVTLHGTPL